MAEAARTLKTNPKLAGQPCGWCAEPLALGADVSLCTTCETAHHAGCWASSAGCSKAECVNAPLKMLTSAPAWLKSVAVNEMPNFTGVMLMPRWMMGLAAFQAAIACLRSW